MGQVLFVVNQADRWPIQVPGVEVLSARRYLTEERFSALRHCRVFNLCRSYSYQSLGYYVSLLAEARGHKPMPRIGTLQDLRFQSLSRAFSSDLNDVIQQSLQRLQRQEFTLSIYFSRNLARQYDRLCREIFNLFPSPLLRVQFVRHPEEGWQLQSVTAISANDIPESHMGTVIEFAKEYFARRRPHPARKSPPPYSLAILTDKQDPTPPSDEKALERFADAAEEADFEVEFIDKDDYGRLAEFDALFIRTTTAVNNYTFRFARRAEAEGLVVIDDAESIVRCTNKVFLAELLNRHKVPTPITEILHRDNVEAVLQQLALPMILKQPDSSFSRGVVKVETADDYRAKVAELLEESDLLIAQEFIRTDFDWRIGVLDRRPLYACKYFMARNHWQIYNNALLGQDDHTGDFETLPVELAPQRVVQTAVKAAGLIGDGLYGVDVKSLKGRCCVIEVNDNPSLDAGVEDKLLRDTLYERIIEWFQRRLEARLVGRMTL
jgi:glutathione synthase/RimK-type ligase-like ATP-grasp enzyme